MKNLKSILKLFVLALAALWIASCSNSFDVAEGATGDAAQPAGHVRVVLGSAGVSKTILPQAWDSDTEDALSYYLSGTGTLSDAGGSTKTLAPMALTFSLITGAGQEIELSPGTWDLTLSAYQLSGDAEPSAANMVLTATNTGIDLTASGSTEAFDLKPVASASTTATGSVQITGSVTSNKYLKFIVQDVCKRGAGSALESANSGNYKTKTPVTENTTGNLSFNYSKDVIAGSGYWYVVDFYNGDPDSTGELLGHYEEALKVDGGNISKKTIALGDYLNSPANNPTKLEVTSAFTNVGLTASATVPNTFLATFVWDDNAGNESGYELKIYKGTVSEGVTTYPETATYTIKKGLLTIGEAAGNVAANSNAAGNANPTMGKNETQASVYLETGATYKASIRAYNRYDENDTSDTPTQITKVQNASSSGGPFGMFTIAYTLGDGNAFVKTGADAADKDENPIYVVGYQYSTEAGTLMPYVKSGNTSTAYPYVTITSANMKWTKWIATVANQSSDDMDAAAQVPGIPAGNINNLKLTGVWKSVANVTVTFPSYEALADTVWLTKYNVGAGADQTITDTDLVSIDASEGDTIVLTFDTSVVSTVTYSLRCDPTTTGTATVDNSAGTVTINTGSLTDGVKIWYLTLYGTGTVTSNGVTETATVSQSVVIKLD